MRALCWNGVNDLSVETVDDPKILNPHDVIVEVRLTTTCGSGLHFIDGYLPGMRAGDVFGHEFMGVVSETGPEVRETKVGDRPRTIEEVQRLQSAVQFFPSRSATADLEIGGTVIPAGSAVHLVYAAANRDPRRFDEPDRFGPLREHNEHFGWGSGIHTCMGGPLARLEVNLALEAFLRRVESPRLVVDPPPYRHNQVFRGPRHLWVDFAGIAD